MNFRAALAGLAVGTVVALSLTSPATAIPHDAQATSDKVSQHAAATTKAQQRRVKEYWTPQRMSAAVAADSGTGEQQLTDGTQTDSGSAAQLASPDPRIGKVFYTIAGADHACSGTATASANGDVVTTAGHCVNGGTGTYVSNFIFVPGWRDGVAPYGVYPAKKLLTTTQWAEHADYNYDVGFAVVEQANYYAGLTDVVGSYPITFDQPRGLSYQIFGYPLESRFGNQQWSCSGTAVANQSGTDGGLDQGVGCDMTNGASGGGWITGGSLNSVSSFYYLAQPGVVWGPYFGAVVKAVYEVASTTV